MSGLTYRTEGAGVFSFGFKINNMLITYSYDHSFSNEIMQYAYGTHEIGLGFRINTNATKRHISFGIISLIKKIEHIGILVKDINSSNEIFNKILGKKFYKKRRLIVKMFLHHFFKSIKLK